MKLKSVLRFLLPLLVLGVGIFGMRALIAAKPEAKKRPVVARGPLVEAISVQRGTAEVYVEAQGTVQPSQQIQVVAEVSGRVIEQNARLMPGGRIASGGELVRIDPRDYRLAVEQAQGQVARAQLEQELERGRKAVAEREWALVSKDMPADEARNEAARARALREPQLKNAQAAVEAAEAAVRAARLRLERTRIKAPFNAIVLQESVDEGQVVGPGAPLAVLAGTDHFWVQVSVPVDDLQWISLPDEGGAGGSEATLRRAGAAEGAPAWTGRVVRLLGDVDPRGRMARVLVEIAAPLDGDDPLLLGTYVDVVLKGRDVDGVFELPRLALREPSNVWIVADSAEGEGLVLADRPVEVARRLSDRVLLSGGISDGTRVITSRLASPVPGMRIRVKGDAEDAQPQRAARGERPPPGEARP